MNKKKSGLSGKRISRRQALRGLGNPKTWGAFSKKVMKEFRTKPSSLPSGIRHFPKGSRDERMNRRIGPRPGQ